MTSSDDRAARRDPEPPAAPMRLEPRENGVAAVADDEPPALTAVQVRLTLEQSRR